MHSVVMQDWTTIRAGTGVTLVTQPEAEWVDLEPFQDVFFWLQASEVSGSPSIIYQTSPTKDDSMFASMNGAGVAIAVGNPIVTQVIMLSATVPLARYVRWQLTGTPSWDATFRVMIAANAPAT